MELRIDPKKIKMKTQRKFKSDPFEALYDLVRQFAVDDDGEPMDADEAESIFDEMTNEEAEVWLQQVYDSIDAAAVSPQTSRSSKNGAKALARRRSG